MILFLPPLAEIDRVNYCTSDDGEVSGGAALNDTLLNRGCRYAADLVQAIDDQNTSPSSCGTNQSPINLSRILSQMGLDTIGKDCVGTDFDSLKSPKDNNTLRYLKLFNTSVNAYLLKTIMHLVPF
jgi:hypothetical protein